MPFLKPEQPGRLFFSDEDLEKVILPNLKKFQKHLLGEEEPDYSLEKASAQCLKELIELHGDALDGWYITQIEVKNVGSLHYALWSHIDQNIGFQNLPE